MLTYRATIPLSTRALTRLAELLRAHRAAIGSRWRRLNPGQQALLVLAHLRGRRHLRPARRRVRHQHVDGVALHPRGR